jgi:hypothetical protein
MHIKPRQASFDGELSILRTIHSDQRSGDVRVATLYTVRRKCMWTYQTDGDNTKYYKVLIVNG